MKKRIYVYTSCLVVLGLIVTSVFVFKDKINFGTQVDTAKKISNKFFNVVIPPAKADGGSDFKSFVRRWYFFVAGYPSAATYKTLTGCSDVDYNAHDCNAEPETGMLGLASTLMSIVEHVYNANGITTCASIPTSGVQRATVTLEIMGEQETFPATIYLGTPVKSTPTGYPANTYTKRVTMNLDDEMKMVAEFNCDRKAGYYGISFNDDDEGERTFEIFFDSEVADSLYADVFMKFVGAGPQLNSDQNFALKLRTASEDLFSYNLVMANQDGVGEYSGLRMQAKGNWSTRKTTALYSGVFTTKTSWTNLADTPVAASTAVEHSYDGGPSVDGDHILFCVDESAPTWGAACDGIALTIDDTNPAIDPTGAWTLQWAAKTDGLASKIWNGVIE